MELQQMIVLALVLYSSLLFAYVPGLSGWYEGKDSQTKQLVMLACFVSAGMAGASCAGISLSVSLPACDQGGLSMQLVEAFVLATLGNVATYATTKYIGKSA
jgi:hypothetical protein